MTRELARRAGLPSVPRLHYVGTPAVQALAAGSSADSAIALSDGLLRLLSRRELSAVIAHEIWHIRQNDLGLLRLALGAVRLTQIMCLAAGLLVLLFGPLDPVDGVAPDTWSLLLLIVLAPSASLLLWLGLSRTREYDADAGAAALTGDPEALASALRHLERAAGPAWERLSRQGQGASPWLRTHPSAAERIARLMELAPPPRLHVPRWRVSGVGPWSVYRR
jgi:heat shock protein HtpX